MAETIMEVYYVVFHENNKQIGYWDDEDECITKNKNHITYFGTKDAAETALKNNHITKKDYDYSIEYCMMSLNEFMTEH